uniref:Protein kinase putative n=1 Tax=Albugo laibachii Nc14 TaxID=890382 RepID=F0WSR0_9STRA|nr:protein kinase putative [Albugo laibachii Nc14]|eukprot:CCA24387.1 protein kinase putative [Albugo laibachii Nc14]
MDMLMHAATLKRRTRSIAKKERCERVQGNVVDDGECIQASECIYQALPRRTTHGQHRTLRSRARTQAPRSCNIEKCPDTPPQHIIRSQSSRKRMITFSPEAPQAQKFMLTDPVFDAENISQSCNNESSTLPVSSPIIEKPLCPDLVLSQSDFAVSETLEFSTLPSPQTTLPAETIDENFDEIVCSTTKAPAMPPDKLWCDGQDLINFSRESSSKGIEVPTDSGISQSIEPEETAHSSNSQGFTSSSVIEDVGLFNCEDDVEYSGRMYGEGTDGTVVAAMIRGHKVALKKKQNHTRVSRNPMPNIEVQWSYITCGK